MTALKILLVLSVLSQAYKYKFVVFVDKEKSFLFILRSDTTFFRIAPESKTKYTPIPRSSRKPDLFPQKEFTLDHCEKGAFSYNHRLLAELIAHYFKDVDTTCVGKAVKVRGKPQKTSKIFRALRDSLIENPYEGKGKGIKIIFVQDKQDVAEIFDRYRQPLYEWEVSVPTSQKASGVIGELIEVQEVKRFLWSEVPSDKEQRKKKPEVQGSGEGKQGASTKPSQNKPPNETKEPKSEKSKTFLFFGIIIILLMLFVITPLRNKLINVIKRLLKKIKRREKEGQKEEDSVIREKCEKILLVIREIKKMEIPLKLGDAEIDFINKETLPIDRYKDEEKRIEVIKKLWESLNDSRYLENEIEHLKEKLLEIEGCLEKIMPQKGDKFNLVEMVAVEGNEKEIVEEMLKSGLKYRSKVLVRARVKLMCKVRRESSKKGEEKLDVGLPRVQLKKSPAETKIGEKKEAKGKKVFIQPFAIGTSSDVERLYKSLLKLKDLNIPFNECSKLCQEFLELAELYQLEKNFVSQNQLNMAGSIRNERLEKEKTSIKRERILKIVVELLEILEEYKKKHVGKRFEIDKVKKELLEIANLEEIIPSIDAPLTKDMVKFVQVVESYGIGNKPIVRGVLDNVLCQDIVTHPLIEPQNQLCRQFTYVYPSEPQQLRWIPSIYLFEPLNWTLSSYPKMWPLNIVIPYPPRSSLMKLSPIPYLQDARNIKLFIVRPVAPFHAAIVSLSTLGYPHQSRT